MPFSGRPIYHVSVLIATHNRKEQLEQCLESLRRQEYPSVDVIVIDNNSTDGTSSMIREDYPEVEYISLEEDRGIGAYNRGASEAEGDLFVFLHDDSELPSPTAVSRIVDQFRLNPELGAAGFRIINGDGEPEEWFEWPKVGDDRRGYKSPTFPSCGSAIRPEIFQRAGGFWEPYFWHVADRDMAVRILNSGSEVRYFPLISIRHRRIHSVRDESRYLYYLTRNTLWYIWRNFGLFRALTKTVTECCRIGRKASRRKGGLVVFLHGLTDALSRLGEVLRTRRPIKAKHRPWAEGQFAAQSS